VIGSDDLRTSRVDLGFYRNRSGISEATWWFEGTTWDLKDGPGGGEERFGVRRDDSEALRNSSSVDRIAWGFSRRDLEFLGIHLLMHRNDLGTSPPDQPLLWSGLESFSIDRGMHRNDLEVYGTTSGLSGRTWSFNSLAWD
jgi:hypothetical protein